MAATDAADMKSGQHRDPAPAQEVHRGAGHQRCQQQRKSRPAATTEASVAPGALEHQPGNATIEMPFAPGQERRHQDQQDRAA